MRQPFAGESREARPLGGVRILVSVGVMMINPRC